ncbi:hypothetical protein G7B21_29300, partial [Klebsiella pneumoniae]|nr:hypothetical protein [Klebsiella pneumoniae]
KSLTAPITPGGHIEGWPDAFKNMMGHFYQAVRARACCGRKSLTAPITPGGHIEGWPDAFKNMMGHFYQAVRA